MKFYYDGQCRRYLVQIMRVFSNIKYERGTTDKIQTTVPVIYGDSSRQVSQILNGQSQNTLLPVPMISVRINDINLAPGRRLNPTQESSYHYTEREFDGESYTENPGLKVTVDRYMPVPYNLTVQVDIWTSNTDVKLQILEQILTIFNPALQLTHTDSIADWTSIFEIELSDITWTNRSVPVGTDTERDVSTLIFDVPIWISPPAKIKRQKLINQIVSDIKDVETMSDSSLEEELNSCTSGSILNRSIITPGNFQVELGLDESLPNNALVLKKSDLQPDITSWKSLFDLYGMFEPGTTKIRLKTQPDVLSEEGDIISFVSDYGSRDDVILLDFDDMTLPDPTNDPVLGFIDPAISWPGKDLNSPSMGDAYIISSKYSNGEESAIPENHPYWGNLYAEEDDVIRFDGTNWVVENIDDYAILYNFDLDNLIKWNGSSWSYAYLGLYKEGFWRIEDLSSEASIDDFLNKDC